MEVVFRVVGSEQDLGSIKPDEENIHFCFRPSETDVFKLVNNCPGLKRIQLPASYHKTLSKTTRTLLSMNNVEIVIGNIWGHRTDIDTYTTVDI